MQIAGAVAELKSRAVSTLPHAGLGAAAEPVAHEFVFGNGRGGLLRYGNQAAALEEPDRGLYRGFRKARAPGEGLQTGWYAALGGAEQFGPEDEVDQEGAGRAVVPGEVGKEDVHDVLVDFDVVHITIVYTGIVDLHASGVAPHNGA